MNSNKQTQNKKEGRKTPHAHLSLEEQLKMFGNVIVERIMEEEQLYQERLKTDPKAKRIYETCECNKCTEKKVNSEKR